MSTARGAWRHDLVGRVSIRVSGRRRRAATGMLAAAAAFGGSWIAATADAAPAPAPPTLGVNYALARLVTAGIAQPPRPTTPGADAVKISYLIATRTDASWDVIASYQLLAAPADGFTSTETINFAVPGGLNYRVTNEPDGTAAVEKSLDGGFTWDSVDRAIIAPDPNFKEREHFTFPDGAWTVPGTTISLTRRDVDTNLDGFESQTPPVLFDVLSGTGFGGTVPLLAQGTVLGPLGLTNDPCTIAGMPRSVSLDPAANSVSFNFDQPPTPDLIGTVGGTDFANIFLFANISGHFTDPLWDGFAASQPVGNFAVSAQGNTVTMSAVNENGSFFTNNGTGLIIGVKDAAGCYSLSPFVPQMAVLAAPPLPPAVVPPPVAPPASVQSTGSVPVSVEASVAESVQTAESVEPVATSDNVATETSDSITALAVGVPQVSVGAAPAVAPAKSDDSIPWLPVGIVVVVIFAAAAIIAAKRKSGHIESVPPGEGFDPKSPTDRATDDEPDREVIDDAAPPTPAPRPSERDGNPFGLPIDPGLLGPKPSTPADPGFDPKPPPSPPPAPSPDDGGGREIG